MCAIRSLTKLFVTAALMIAPTSLIAGEVITIAGNGNDEYTGDGGPAIKAGLSNPFGLEIDPQGKTDLTGHIHRGEL